MKTSIDIKITYDDLSEECKQKIKKLEKELDCTINLIYPDITSMPNTSFGKTYPHIPHVSGSSGDGFINAYPGDGHNWRGDITLCNSKAVIVPEKAVYGKIKHPDGSTSSTSIWTRDKLYADKQCAD